MENLKDILYENSGVQDLMNIIKQHFGNRAFLIKLRYVIIRVKTLCYSILNDKYENSSGILNTLNCIISECEKLEASETDTYFKILTGNADNIINEDVREIEDVVNKYVENEITTWTDRDIKIR